MNRRHLTSSQKALIAFHALPMFEAEAKERQGTRTDLQENIGEILPQSKDRNPKATEYAAAAVGG